MTFPFSAVVGMDDLKLALLLNAVAPGIGGVLVRGEKGTAKSTAVRALAALLPMMTVVADCRFGCDAATPEPACPDGPHGPGAACTVRRGRLVELPVGAAEDRVVGSLDLERALSEGVRAFSPGLLADANRGVLYVDEVNLLHDHLVDVLLDAAALGRCYVEREGVSVSHAARFLLVGTMNPEEGELRPQLLDRFGLTVSVCASRDPAQRVEVVRRGLAFEADPDGFAARWAADDADLAAQIVDARARLGTVELPDDELHRIAVVCAAFDVDGMRADLVIARTALAHAAWFGRDRVDAADVAAAARLALPHRRRRDPFDAPGLDDEALEKALAEAEASMPAPPDDDPDPPDPATNSGTSEEQRPAGYESSDATVESPATGLGDAGPGGHVAAPGQPFRTRVLTVPGTGSGTPGRRSPARTDTGRTVGSRRPEPGRARHVHLSATIVAAALNRAGRPARAGSHGEPVAGPRLRIGRDDLRHAVREGRESNLVLFCVDASGSMAARARMSAVKTAVLSLLLDAYQRRDKVGLVTFRGCGARVDLPPTSSVEAGGARLRALATGGRTPLAEGLHRARGVLAAERLRDPYRRALLVLVTDGRATTGPEAAARATTGARALAGDGVAAIVVDCEDGYLRLGLAADLAETLRAPVLRLDDLGAAGLGGLVREIRKVA
ncbi:MAG: magnesium chelatase subunit D family protein [Sporichthyaceae bacterium]